MRTQGSGTGCWRRQGWVRQGWGQANGRAVGRKHKTGKSRQTCQSKQESKIFSCHNHKIKGPRALPRGMKQQTGDECRERLAYICCRCEEQGTKLMSSRCAEEAGCSRYQEAPPSHGGKENMDTEREQRPTGSWHVVEHFKLPLHYRSAVEMQILLPFTLHSVACLTTPVLSLSLRWGVIGFFCLFVCFFKWPLTNPA